MMTKPGITELSRCVDSRYTLVAMASKRARMIGDHTIEDNGKFIPVKPVSIAAGEIADGKIGYIRSDSIREAQEYEAAKEAAILQYTEDVQAAAEEAYEDNNELPVDDETDETF